MLGVVLLFLAFGLVMGDKPRLLGAFKLALVLVVVAVGMPVILVAAREQNGEDYARGLALHLLSASPGEWPARILYRCV